MAPAMHTIPVEAHDHRLIALFDQVRAQPGSVEAMARLCFELNVRSYHDHCICEAEAFLLRVPDAHDVEFEMILASSLNKAHALEAMGDRFRERFAEDGDLRLKRNLALIHFYLEQDDLAGQLLEEVLEARSQTLCSRFFEVLAQTAYAREDLEMCVEACDHGINAPGPSARLLRLKGLCFMSQGQLEEAIDCFHLALELEPHFVWACHSLAVVHVERGDLASAMRFFGRGTSINPYHPGNYFLPAEAFLDRGAYDLASAEYTKFLMLNPEPRLAAEAHNALGYVKIKQGQDDAARKQLGKALALEPELAVAHYNLGRLAFLNERLNLATRHFRAALAIDPKHVESMVELGFVDLSLNKLRAARRHFEAALAVNSTQAQALLGLSKVHQKRNCATEQLAFAKMAHEQDPENSDVCNNLGIAFECNGMLDEADEAYEMALAANPMHSQAANNLGYLLERRMKENPDDVEYWRNRAVAAWTTRLQICEKLKKSVKGATQHLLNLGLNRAQIRKLARKPYP